MTTSSEYPACRTTPCGCLVLSQTKSHEDVILLAHVHKQKQNWGTATLYCRDAVIFFCLSHHKKKCHRGKSHMQRPTGPWTNSSSPPRGFPFTCRGGGREAHPMLHCRFRSRFDIDQVRRALEKSVIAAPTNVTRWCKHLE